MGGRLMRWPRVIAIIGLLIFAFLLAGCEATPAAEDPSTAVPETPPNAPKNTVTVFYKWGDYLVPVSMSAETSQPAAKAAVEVLFSSVVPGGFENPLSEVALHRLTIDGDTVTVDVSEEMLTGDAATKREQLIFTLMWCDHVSKVDLLVEGQVLENVLKTPWAINLYNPEAVEDLDPEEYLTIYYVDADTKTYLIPVTLKSDILPAEDREQPLLPVEKAKAALEHLTEAPEDLQGLTTIFPEHLEAKSVKIEDGIARVDVDKRLLMNLVGDMRDAKPAVESIVMTLTSIEGIDKVQLSIDGKGYVVSNFNLSKPLSRIKGINSID